MDFEELTQQWISGENVYGSGCQLVGTTPSSIFEMSFANKRDGFLRAVLKDGSKESPEFVMEPWTTTDLPTDEQTQFSSIKQRTISVKVLGSGLAFFLKKEGPKTSYSEVTQTAFFGAGLTIRNSIHSVHGISILYMPYAQISNIWLCLATDSLTIYSVSKVAAGTMINRFTIKQLAPSNESEEESKVALCINANIVTDKKCPCSPLVKSKWLKFYQSHFESVEYLMFCIYAQLVSPNKIYAHNILVDI